MKRREFLTTTMAASTLAGLGTASLTASAAEPAGARAWEYYELRVYKLKSGANHDLLDGYIEKAAIPALNRLGVKPVGVFTEIDPKDGPAVYVLRTFPSLEVMAAATARLGADTEYQKAGAEGMKKLKLAGAATIAQNEDSCVVYGMPRAAVELGVVDRV